MADTNSRRIEKTSRFAVMARRPGGVAREKALARAENTVEGFKADYVTISNSKTLQPAAVDDRQITILGAMYTASARLIDNISISLK